jgi:hypothetical protein
VVIEASKVSWALSILRQRQGKAREEKARGEELCRGWDLVGEELRLILE